MHQKVIHDYDVISAEMNLYRCHFCASDHTGQIRNDPPLIRNDPL